MPKKSNKPRLDPIFRKARKRLPHNYMADLAKLLPDLEKRQIVYAMEMRCRDLSLKEQVLNAMVNLAQDTQKRSQKLAEAAAQ